MQNLYMGIKRVWQRRRGILTPDAAIVALAISCAALCSCASWQAGKDPAGIGLQAESERIAAALRTYRSRQGMLPEQLDELVPAFIPTPASSAIRYNRSLSSLVITYSPTWPQIGKVVCTTSIERVSWHCRGLL